MDSIASVPMKEHRQIASSLVTGASQSGDRRVARFGKVLSFGCLCLNHKHSTVSSIVSLIMSTTLKGNYPTMKIRDIVHALAGWGIPVSPEQLKNPSPEFVEGVYSACLQQVTDLTSEVLNEPVQSALNNSQVDDPVCCFIQSYAFHLFMHIPSQDLYSSALSNTIMLHHL